MNILLTSAGRRTYLVEYFKEALQMAGVEGQVHTANSQECPAFYAADQWRDNVPFFFHRYSVLN